MHGDWNKIQTTFASVLGSNEIWSWWRVNGVGNDGKFAPIGINDKQVASIPGNDGTAHGIKFIWQKVPYSSDPTESALYVSIDDTYIFGPIINNTNQVG